MTISEKILRLKAINLSILFDNSIKHLEKDILDMNRDQMYEDGIMNVKTEKTERYSPATIRSKKRASFPFTDHVTLKWEGDFHGSLKLLIFAEKIVISSTNLTWANWLETNKRFANALGLTEDNIKKLRDLVRKEFIIQMENLI